MQKTVDSQLSECVFNALGKIEGEEAFDPDNGQTTYHSPLWTLASGQGFCPDWSAWDAWHQVNEAVRNGLGQWEDWEIPGMYGVGEDELQAEFINAFEKCRIPGGDPLAAALDRSKSHPFTDKVLRNSVGYTEFVDLAASLPVVLDQNEFQLPARKTADILGVRANTVSVWTDWAKKDGVIELAKRHSKKSRMAWDYRLVGDAATWADAEREANKM